METIVEKTQTSSSGLENIPVVDIDAEDETEIVFSYSVPERVDDFLNKWKPKIHDVVSMVEEEVIEYSDDEEEDWYHKKISNDHNTVYINEDTIKQEEEFEDENVEVLNENEDELNISFDEDKVKTENNINESFSIKLERVNPLKIQNYFSIVNGILPNNSRRTKLSTKNVSRPRNNDSSTNSRSKSNRVRLVRKKFQKPKNLESKKQSSTTMEKNTESNESKKMSVIKKCRSSITKKINEKNDSKSKIIDERRSLRLSGKGPEFENGLISDLSVNNPLFTSRSGKKRTLPPDLSVNRREKPSELSSKRKEKPIEVPTKRIRSLSPSAYRKNITEMYVCVCCDHKYSSLEQIREHIKSHFPNVRFD